MSDTTPVTITGATTYRGQRIQQLQQQISELETAKSVVLTTGKSYSLSNSHAVTRADIDAIQSELAALKTELAALLRGSVYQPMRLEPTKFY
jgi:repressor of nif and glnA expression